jgi:hypothetical protein
MEVRTNFHKLELKKSGHNKFANFKYFELGDFLVPATKLLNEIGLCPIIIFTDELAKMTLVNTDNPSETIEFTSPMRDLELKGANSMQSLGGVETYQTRYLYIQLLNIVENDSFDRVSGTEDNKEINTSKKYTGNIRLISEAQLKRLYMLANGIDSDTIKEIIGKYGFSSSKDITMNEYNNICNEIENLKARA